MTIPSTTRRAGPYLGTGALVSYPFSFKVFDKTDVRAVISDTLGIESDLVVDSSALVTLNVDQVANPGGSLQYAVAGVAAALPSGYSLSILSALPYAPLMTSAARSVGLYNFDTSNVACYGDRPINTGSGINLPLGTVTGIGTLPTQDEGTFTPTVVSSAGANTGITYATQQGRWVRVGSRVTVTINIKWSGWTGPAGNLVLRGVPVALEPVTYSPANLGNVLGLMPWTGANLYAYMNGSGRDIVIAQNATGGTSTLLAMAANGELAVDLTYTI